MAQTDVAGSTTRSNVTVWIFRILVIAGAAFMIYSWITPWWSAKVAVIPGDNHMVMHPWGVDAVAQVRANTDTSQFDMPFFFAPLMWTYLVACMLLLAGSLVVKGRLKLGPINLPLATAMIAAVGLSYMIAVGSAYGIGVLRAGWAGANFVGKSTLIEPQSDAKIKMVSQLEIGFWLSLAAGGVLTFLALIRGFLVREPKAPRMPKA